MSNPTDAPPSSLDDLARRLSIVPGWPEDWVPDLTDYGVGGALLELLTGLVAMLPADPPPYVYVAHNRLDDPGRPWLVEVNHVRPHDVAHYGATLAEAVAKVLVELFTVRAETRTAADTKRCAVPRVVPRRPYNAATSAASPPSGCAARYANVCAEDYGDTARGPWSTGGVATPPWVCAPPSWRCQ